METIGFISAIIAFIIGVLFLVITSNSSLNNLQKQSYNSRIYKQSSSFGDIVLAILGFVFIITFFLSTILTF